MTENIVNNNNQNSLQTATVADGVNLATFSYDMHPHLNAWLSALQHGKDILPSDLQFKELHQSIQRTLDMDDGTEEYTDNEPNSATKEGQISLDLIEQLDALAVFSLIVVVQKQALDGFTANTNEETSPSAQHAFEKHIGEWATDNEHWQLIAIADNTGSDNANATNDELTPVYVYRYILLPTNALGLSTAKKEAAAHMLDDAITSHLRQFIDTLPITLTMGGDAAIDCHIVPLAKILRPHKVACFDMDSTLIEQEVIVELANKAGIGEQVSRITEAAMRGEIDFNTSFSQRLALLEGLSTDVLDDIQQKLVISAGAQPLLKKLKQLGYHTVLVSGGFTYFAERIAAELGIDEVHANLLDIEEGIVTGDVSPPIVDGERKAALVEKIAGQQGVSATQVVCVGDGANDLAMMAYADLGIAYHAKPIVRARADAAINATGLEGVLYILGYATNELR